VKLKIVISNKWTFYTPCNDDGSSDLYSFLENLESKYDADKAGLVEKLSAASDHDQGPKLFNENICHYVDETNKIFQIRHRTLRLLMFYSTVERRAIICSLAFIKRSDKTPPSKIRNAVFIKQQYEAAIHKGRIVVLSEEEDEQ
jgi:hypothetical protein